MITVIALSYEASGKFMFKLTISDDTYSTALSARAEDIITKYLTPFKPKNTKPKTAARQRYADKQRDKQNKEVKGLLDGGAEEIINTSVSADEARAKINMFLK